MSFGSYEATTCGDVPEFAGNGSRGKVANAALRFTTLRRFDGENKIQEGYRLRGTYRQLQSTTPTNAPHRGPSTQA